VLGVALRLDSVDLGFDPFGLVVNLPDDLLGGVIGLLALGEGDR
jgi:hypothetical protein